MTGITSNIDQVIAKFKANISNIDVSDSLTAGVNAAMGEMKFRIFNKGLDAYEKSLGKYRGRKSKGFKFKSEKSKTFLAANQSAFSEYELKRVSKGRQINYKDLEFTGDLRRGIKVVKENATKVVCVIVNQKLILISQGQEQQIGTDIFKLSENELETFKTNTNEAIKQQYSKAFNS